MKVFKNNEFFAGLSIPEPDVRESLEARMPRDFSSDGMDFLKVLSPLKSLSIHHHPSHYYSFIDLDFVYYRNASTKIRPNGTRATNFSVTPISPTLISACPNLNWKNTNVSGDCDLVLG